MPDRFKPRAHNHPHDSRVGTHLSVYLHFPHSSPGDPRDAMIAHCCSRSGILVQMGDVQRMETLAGRVAITTSRLFAIARAHSTLAGSNVATAQTASWTLRAGRRGSVTQLNPAPTKSSQVHNWCGVANLTRVGHQLSQYPGRRRHRNQLQRDWITLR